MELNQPIHNEGEHASISLKIVLLIFAVVLVAALGYLVWQQNHAADTTDNSAPSVKKTATTTKTDTTAATAVACGNQAYAFSLTFGNLWTGYKIKEVTSSDAIITCYFELPTTSSDAVWTTAAIDHDAKYASLFAVSVYTPTQWTAAQAEANKPTKLGENTNYVWGWSPAQAYPDNFATASADVKNVVATFAIAN